ncbi:MAG: cytosine deaminase [Rhodospirillales bacterium]|nr:cytosine deaminase [Rhodospirillales bacterium]
MTETLLTADAVVTMAPGNPVLSDAGILVRGSSIVAIGDPAELAAQAPGAARRDFGKSVLMPGLINTHCHSGILRGTAEGLSLWDWLRLYIDPMHRVLRPDEAEAASLLCYGESLLSGTTTLVDMWRFMEGSARAAEDLGNRVVLVPYVGAAEGFDYFDTLDDNEALIRASHGAAGGRINVWVGLEHQFYATPEACRRAAALCDRYGVGLHTHSNESRDEVTEARRRYGVSPIRSLEHLGLLAPEHVLIAHCVWLEDEEIELLSRHRIGVAHNPVSNMKLASGAAPVAALIAAGIAVGIGTDGEKENNNLDMFEEMKFASLLGKLRAMDAAALGSWEVLRAATIEGARALGMDHLIGSLAPGKRADIIAVRADTPRMTPFLRSGAFGNLHHNLVHAAQGGDVVMTMVDGRIVAENGVLRHGDMNEFIAAAERAFAGMVGRRSAWLAEHEHGALSPV